MSILRYFDEIRFKLYEFTIRPFLKRNNAKLIKIKKNRYVLVYIPNVGIVELRVPKREYII